MACSLLIGLLALLLLPIIAVAEDQIPIRAASDLKGKWSGVGGPGAFGGSTVGTFDVTFKDDGTFVSVFKNRSGQTFTTQGSFEPKGDGTATASGRENFGTYRLFDVNGKRLLRFEGKSRRTGESTWGEVNEEK